MAEYLVGRRKIESFAIGFNDLGIFISIPRPLREPLRDRVDSKTSRARPASSFFISYKICKALGHAENAENLYAAPLSPHKPVRYRRRFRLIDHTEDERTTLEFIYRYLRKSVHARRNDDATSSPRCYFSFFFFFLFFREEHSGPKSNLQSALPSLSL